MQVSATSPARQREHEKPMSWARAVLIAIGFFFAAIILIGQFPSFVYNAVTLATLQTMQSSFLDFALLSIGIGLLCFTLVMLYDPRPLIPWPLFALAGAVLALVGFYFVYQVFVGAGATNVLGQPGWSHYLPDRLPNGQYWPIANQGYILNPLWLQPQSIDLSAVGMIAIVIGLGMFGFAALNPLVLSGRFVGPLRDLLVRLSLGLSFVILALWLTINTFFPGATMPAGSAHGAIGNVILFIALLLALFGLQIWLLPIMVANRQQFMPATYLHGVVGLLGSVGVPFLVIWALTYPVVDAIHNADSAQFWVSCSKKNDIPGSCTFTPYTGYIICAVVFSAVFGLFILGLYFWSTRRNTVVLGASIGIVWAGMMAMLLHTVPNGNDYSQVPMGMVLATGIVILAFIFTWATQREFAPTYAEQLGCTGQWLVLGTLALVYIAGFAYFSLPNFFEIEALGLFYTPGNGNQHDAFWVLLLIGALALFQFVLLARRKPQPMNSVRKFAMWVMGIAVLFEVAGAIIGFHNDVLVTGVNGMEGSHAIFVAGMCFEAVGIAATILNALRAGSVPWAIGIGALTLVGAAIAFVAYNLPTPYPELVVAGFVFAMVGAFAYIALGPDPVDPYEAALLNGGYGGNGGGYTLTQ